MNIQRIKAEKLIPAEYNPRKNLKKSDVEYKKIERSVQEFGYVDPIIVNKDMTIIGGHQRYKVLVDLGYDELDCVVVDLPKDREKALNVALNKISGEWDEALLIEMLGALGDLAELTGFDVDEIEDLLELNNELPFELFDGGGDGGGSQMQNGTKVRVVIGRLMFDIDDKDHAIYAKTKDADPEIVKNTIVDLINRGELL